MAPNNTGKPTALAGSNHIDILRIDENIDQNLIARLEPCVLAALSRNFDRNLAHQLHRRHIVLSEVASHRLVDLVALDELNQTNLRRGVTVRGRRLELG